MLGAVIGGGSVVFTGVIILLIVSYLHANIPNQSDITKMMMEQTAKMQGCGDNLVCKNTVQQSLNIINTYQKESDARATAQLFGLALIVLPPVLGLISLVRS